MIRLEQNDDYSGFIQHNGYVLGVLGAFAVFTFGAVCLIITVIPDPSKSHIQFTLLFLSVLFYISLYLLGDGLTRNLSLCRKRSVYDRHDVMYNIGVFTLFYLFGLNVVLIFLVWNLYVLSSISAITYVITGILGVRFVIQPLLQQRGLDRPQNLNTPASCP